MQHRITIIAFIISLLTAACSAGGIETIGGKKWSSQPIVLADSYSLIISLDLDNDHTGAVYVTVLARQKNTTATVIADGKWKIDGVRLIFTPEGGIKSDISDSAYQEFAERGLTAENVLRPITENLRHDTPFAWQLTEVTDKALTVEFAGRRLRLTPASGS